MQIQKKLNQIEKITGTPSPIEDRDYTFMVTVNVVMYSIRLVISLGSDIEIITCKGENNSTNMHQISKQELVKSGV